MTCGILIWSRRQKKLMNCEAEAFRVLEFRGDSLIAICHRHRSRLAKAFPELAA